MGILHRRGCIFQHVAFSLKRSRQIAQDGPRWPKLGPTWPQHGPKMAPRRPQDGPKMVPRRLRDASLTKSKIQAGLKMAQVASKLPLTCHLPSDVAGKFPQDASEEGFQAVKMPSWADLGPILGRKIGILYRRACIFQHVPFSLLRSLKIAQDGPR